MVIFNITTTRTTTKNKFNLVFLAIFNFNFKKYYLLNKINLREEKTINIDAQHYIKRAICICF